MMVEMIGFVVLGVIVLVVVGALSYFHYRALKRSERLEAFIMALVSPVAEASTRDTGDKESRRKAREAAEKEVTYREVIRRGSASGKELNKLGIEKSLI